MEVFQVVIGLRVTCSCGHMLKTEVDRDQGVNLWEALQSAVDQQAFRIYMDQIQLCPIKAAAFVILWYHDVAALFFRSGYGQAIECSWSFSIDSCPVYDVKVKLWRV